MAMRDLEEGLTMLPPDQREDLMLVCVQEVSYRQVAEILDLPVGRVMSRLHRARERMRLWMRGEMQPKLRRVK